MSFTSRQRRDHTRSVRHRIEHQQAAREQQGLEAQIDTPDEFERDRQMARITLDCYGWIPLTDQFYLRNLGLNDVCRGSRAWQPRQALPPVLSTRRKG
ncbi:hypothetical protein [Deinococcus altitudinis]|uniref:hypothetical protein n=1 Tax=Deinococcus altitudinis TaxID=468914 RepID=UPI00389262CB